MQIVLSSSTIIILKVLSISLTVFFIIFTLISYKKNNKKQFYTGFIFTKIFIVISILIFSSKIKSREEIENINKLKKETFEIGEEIISTIEAFKKQKNRYPLNLDELKLIDPDIKLKGPLKTEFFYSTDNMVYRLYFKFEDDPGYYFYNSATGSNRFKGYLFKYMHSNLIK